MDDKTFRKRNQFHDGKDGGKNSHTSKHKTLVVAESKVDITEKTRELEIRRKKK